jgi:hypothetical protein
MPGSNFKIVFSGKDLNPNISSSFRYIFPLKVVKQLSGEIIPQKGEKRKILWGNK